MMLVTGATGFVGRQVLRHLADQGQRLRLVVRSNQSATAELTQEADVIETPDLFHETHQWWLNALDGVDTVVHVAWYVEPGQYLQSEQNLDCLTGTLYMARACVEAGVRRVVGVGTCFEYDLSRGMLPVDTPLRPTTVYAACKASTYLTLSQWLEARNIEFAWCRLFYLHGEGEDSRRLVPYLRAKLTAGESAELTSGKQIRDFLDVREAGRMIAEVARSDQLGAVNICSGIPITVRQLAQQIADEYRRRDLLQFGVRPDNLVDPPCVVGVR